MRAFISAFFVAFVLKTCTGADWCYQSQVTCDSHCKGPDIWKEVHENCGKQRQSPINIITRKANPDTRLTPLVFNGYQQTFNTLLKNNGHTVFGTVPHVATISGGNLKSTYKAVQFHFHWGDQGGPGSEHTLDGEQFPMELHIVHMKENFKSLSDAQLVADGVAVLGFFYEESQSSNRKYEELVKSLKNVASSGANTTLSSFSLDSLILSEVNMTTYYRYEGSLTTPDCSEAVVWTVYKYPIPLSKEQLAAFSALKFTDGKAMVKNFRPLQAPKGRPVYYSGGAKVLMTSFTLFLLCLSTAVGLSQLN